MRFGMTYEQKRVRLDQKQRHLKNLQNQPPHKWFAWYPVRLGDGQWAVFETVWCSSRLYSCGGLLYQSPFSKNKYHRYRADDDFQMWDSENETN